MLKQTKNFQVSKTMMISSYHHSEKVVFWIQLFSFGAWVVCIALGGKSEWCTLCLCALAVSLVVVCLFFSRVVSCRLRFILYDCACTSQKRSKLKSILQYNLSVCLKSVYIGGVCIALNGFGLSSGVSLITYRLCFFFFSFTNRMVCMCSCI